MPKSRKNDPPEEEDIWDMATINEKLAGMARESQMSAQVRDARCDRLESTVQGNCAAIKEVDGKIEALTRMFTDYISSKQREAGDGSNSTMRATGPSRRREFHEGSQSHEGDRHDLRREYRYHDYQHNSQRVNLPRIDFPSFGGGSPVDWFEECKFYFDMYQIPEEYKTRMATMNFFGVAKEWFSSFRLGHANPPWPVLVDEIFVRFRPRKGSNSVIQMRKIQQIGTVDDGLKVELQNPIQLFKPKSLNDAINLALEVEEIIGPTDKRLNLFKPQTTFNSKPPLNQNFRPNRPPDNHKRAMNLCYKCNEKWFQGHKCQRGLHAIDAEEEQEEGQGCIEQREEEANPNGEEEEEEEEQTVTLNSISNPSYNQTLQFKGFMKEIPICALFDTGASHSFIHPNLVHNLSLETVKIKPLRVWGALGNKVVSNTMCKGVEFTIQGQLFSANLRVLEHNGYDIILGVDWIARLGTLKMNLEEGMFQIKRDGKKIRLVSEGVKAEVHVCEGEIDVTKEKKKGNHVIYAQLFKLEGVEDKQSSDPDPLLQKIMHKYNSVFEEPQSLPPRRWVDHKIELKPGSQPFSQRPYRFSHFQKLEVEKIVQELLRNSLIQHSTSNYASPVLLVKKKDGTWRMCIDYRKLNEETVKNKFPIPIIDDLLDELNGAKYFSKLDLRSGYHQILMAEEDVSKTAFCTHEGLYEFKVMPFGLTNAPATFQALMNRVFKAFLRKFILVFFDDILVFSRDLEAHAKHLELTFQTLKEHQLYVKKSKCEFGVQQVHYLGHIISSDGVSTDPAKVKAMVQWPTPKDVKGLRGFLGLTGYYRKFIKGYGTISRPLTELLKNGAFKWNPSAQEAFEELKRAMVAAPVLILPDFKQPFVVEVDASQGGIGAVLMQCKRPIAFFSKKLGVKSQALSTYEKELLALFTAVSKWKHYLLGGEFVIRTDQISLKYLLEQKVNTPMQHKGLSKLLGLNYKIEYKKGVENKVADALSRREGYFGEDETEINGVSELIPQWVNDIKENYVNDEWIKELRRKLRESSENSDQAASHRLTEQQGVVRYKNRICVGDQKDWRDAVLREVHASSLGGHSGITATCHRAKKHFYWPKMEDVHQFVQRCENCHRSDDDFRMECIHCVHGIELRVTTPYEFTYYGS
ncbi:uncharacterized protein LOC144561976 [Carex rostrata]